MTCIPWSLFPSKSQYPLDDCVPRFSPTSLLSLITHPNDHLGFRRACESSQSHPKGSHRVLEGNNSAETSHLDGTCGLHHRKSRRFPVQVVSLETAIRTSRTKVKTCNWTLDCRVCASKTVDRVDIKSMTCVFGHCRKRGYCISRTSAVF